MGAGLDVYEKEPSVHKDLVQLKNVFLLPHLEAQPLKQERQWVSESSITLKHSFFDNKEPIDRVV